MNENSAGTVTFVATLLDDMNLPTTRSVPIEVTYETRDETALAGTGLDYEQTSGTILFPPNTSSQTFTVTVFDDDFYEDPDAADPQDPETFVIALTTESPFAEALTEVTVSILDQDDPKPADPVANLEIDTLFVNEGSCPGVSADEPCEKIFMATFTITLTSELGVGGTLDPAAQIAADEVFRIHYETKDASAFAGEDYEATSGDLIFAHDKTSKTVTVPIWADRGIEGDEAFSVVLSAPVLLDASATLLPDAPPVLVLVSTGMGIIRDDDYLKTAFGANGSNVTRESLIESGPENESLSQPVDFNAAEFEAYKYNELFGWVDNELTRIDLVSGEVFEVADTSMNAGTPSPPIFTEDWGSGTDGWDFTGLWHTVLGNTLGANSGDGTLAARFGNSNAASFSTGARVTGTATMNVGPVIPSTALDVRLEFDDAIETEGGTNWDRATIQYSIDGGGSWINTAFNKGTQSLVWGPEVITVTNTTPIAGLLGKTILFRFTFDSIDHLYNDFAGWFVDNIEIIIDEPALAAPIAFGEFWTGLAWDHTNGIGYATNTVGGIHTITMDTGSTSMAELVNIDGDDATRDHIPAIAVHPTTGRVYVFEVDDAVTTSVTLHSLIPGEWTFKTIGVLTDVTPMNTSKIDLWDADFDDATGELFLKAYLTDDGGKWVLLEVDLEDDGGVGVKRFTDEPAVSSMAIATPPPPSSTRWTGDLPYASRAPDGFHLSAASPGLDGASAGAVVTGVGDVNGDGSEDFLIAAPNANDVDANANTISSVGKVFLFYGGSSAVADIAARLIDSAEAEVEFGDDALEGIDGVLFKGTTASERLGVSASGLGDLDGDGKNDFAIGYQAADLRGGAYIVYGSSILPPVVSSNAIGDTNLGATVDGLNIRGGDPTDAAAASISSAGDMNSDGFMDIIIGAAGANQGFGAAYIVFGANARLGTGGLLNLKSLAMPAGFTLLGEDPDDTADSSAATQSLGATGFGEIVSGIGDVNGDGIDDVAIGAPAAKFGTFAAPDLLGGTYVIFGHVDYVDTPLTPLTPNIIDLARLSDDVADDSLDATLVFTTDMPPTGKLSESLSQSPLIPESFSRFTGKLPGMRITGEGGGYGKGLAGLGDVNGDSIDDFIASAPTFDGSALGGGVEPHWGRHYLLLGSDSFDPDVDAGDTGGTVGGLLLQGIDLGDQTVGSVAGAGDINGDGLMDVLIGAPNGTPEGNSGEAYLVFGSPVLGGVLSLRDLAHPDPNAARGRYFNATHPGMALSFARSVNAAGDINDDGFTDMLFGRDSGAFLFFGESDKDRAIYTNRMRSGKDPIGDVIEGNPANLGEEVFRGVGRTGTGNFARPESRVAIKFKGGGTGPSLTGPSTQRATIFRFMSPDINIGEFDVMEGGSVVDDERWTPTNIHWRVETDREQFSESELELFYVPGDVEGFDLQNVGVFYAKPTETIDQFTHWTSMPFTHNPDRRVFTVSRVHGPSRAQDEFNGYYALIDADLLTELGSVIPAVGVTNDNVYAFGPEIIPEEMAFWHLRDRRLYAVREGEFTVRWKDTFGTEVSNVTALNVWPSDESGKFQTHVADSPPVDLKNTDGEIEFKYMKLTGWEETVITDPDQIATDNAFGADLTRNFDPLDVASSDDPSVWGRSIVMLSNHEDPGTGDLFFQLIKTIKWNNPTYRIGGETGVPWNIGTVIMASTDSNYAGNHDDIHGAPHVFFELSPYAAYSPDSSVDQERRYVGFYDRPNRAGSIVPVNRVMGAVSPLVLVFYESGQKLIDAQTGGFVRDPATREKLALFGWPHVPARYNPDWPTNPREIIIARQDGSGEQDVATFGSTLDVYNQNFPTKPGYNPNEEHALIRPYGTSEAVFALRDDLNEPDTSETFVLMTYYDPNDQNLAGDDRAKMRVFSVAAERAPYFFHEWVGFEGVDDPYEGDAGAFILPPYPISTLKLSPRNTGLFGPYFQDRNNSFWAAGAGNTVVGIDESGLEVYDDADIGMRFYYPLQADFSFPGIDPAVVEAVAADGLDLRFPHNVTYTVGWPQFAPTMKVGEILIEAKFGLPQINGQCSVDTVYQTVADNFAGQSSVQLIDPTFERSVFLKEVPSDISVGFSKGEKVFTDLPPGLFFKISYDDLNQSLKLRGILVDPVLGFDYVLLNVMTDDEERALRALSTDVDWQTAITELAAAAAEPHLINDSSTDPFDVLALTSGFAQGVGYVTLAMQNSDACAPLPVSIEIIRVVPDLDPGRLAVVKPGCVFEEKLTIQTTLDFSGKPEEYEFEWLYLPDENGTLPDPPNLFDVNDPWSRPPLNSNVAGLGVNSITIEGPGLVTLTDNWYTMRYRIPTTSTLNVPWKGTWSEFAPVQLGEGWIKRVVGSINPFTQRAGGGGIAGAEAQFASFGDEAANTVVSMISQAGPRFTGSIPLNCDDLNAFGLIPIYQTVLNRGKTLSINALSPVNHPLVNTALLLVASRINDLYMLLGNEAYADAQDPTIAFGTDDGVYGEEATSIHSFMNQTSSLLEEELGLLRGRDDQYAPGTQLFPVYNNLIWNFTRDITGGEVAYALNYNLADDVEAGDGVISEADAKSAYPQGHGDAWGHYLTSLKAYYGLLNHPFYAWANRSEAVLVGGEPITVDYIDERKFAVAAAAKARTGAEIMGLQYRWDYTEDSEGQFQGYRDENLERAWGLSEWASRAGQGAYIDWVVGNGILRAVDPDDPEPGITQIDRTNVYELRDVSAAFIEIESKAGMADSGLNPLGLARDAIPFDISPSQIDDGLTHFEQIYERALTAVNNAVAVFDHANNSTQALRRQGDSLTAFQRGVQDQEIALNNQLIEVFGYPYAGDIGPGKTYETGYSGPDLLHYFYVEDSEAINEFGLRNAPNTLDYEVTLLDDLSVSILGIPTSTRRTVSFSLATTGNRFGVVKPSGLGQRRAVGELQQIRRQLIQELGALNAALDDYGDMVELIDDQVALLLARRGLTVANGVSRGTQLGVVTSLRALLVAAKAAEKALGRSADIISDVAEGAAEAIPKVTGLVAGLAAGPIIDTLSAARGALKVASVPGSQILYALADISEVLGTGFEQGIETANMGFEFGRDSLADLFSDLESFQELQVALREELGARLTILTSLESTAQIADQWLAKLAQGQRLVEDRDLLRRRTTADIQGQRYRDMAFRIFRSDALEKYRAQYDLAARYVYLAAKAYDYETTLLSSDPKAGEQFLTDIVRKRLIGTVTDGLPQTGQGLADVLAQMQRNFQVQIGQLGFNNPQQETNRFSLRNELFRVLPGPDGDQRWRDALSQDYSVALGAGIVSNLWDLPEFGRLAVPPDGWGAVEPGIVISFSSEVTEGLNFFGKEMGGLDSSYDSTQFATKIRSVGIWFSNYDFLGLSNTPRIYLLPVGIDIMRSPTGFSGRERRFRVLDQLLPTPFPIAQDELDDPFWISTVDGMDGSFATIRRHGRFRAFHDSGQFSVDEMHRDSRLIGRSVWNTRWMLIIPASTLHSDRNEGLNRFINGQLVGGERNGNGVTDIRLFFETYAYPRLKKSNGEVEKIVAVTIEE